MMQNIDLGTVVNDGTGDPLRTGGQKINENFADLDTRVDAALAAGEEAGESAATATETANGAATLAQEAKSLADNAQVRLTPGENITIDNTDPLAPVISATGGGGGEGTVTSVAGVVPVAGDVPLGDLSEALGIDDKLGKTETAAAALKLANPVNINGVAFDGESNITIEDSTKEPAITAGQSTDYWNGSKGWTNFFSSVRSATLTGIVFTSATAVVAADTVLTGLGKLQRQVSDAVTAIGLRAVKGVNGDITQLTGLTTPLSVSQGGTGSSSGVATATGATSSTPGTKGLVPAPPQLGSNPKFLADDMTFKEPAGGGGLAVGTMFPWKFSRATIPGGSLPHDGQIVTNGRTLYPEFWALIQPFCVSDPVWLAAPYTSRGMFSSGDGSTNFRMPDDNAKHTDGNTIAAMFLRGDGKNSAGTPGLHQADQMQQITGASLAGTDIGTLRPAANGGTATGAFKLSAASQSNVSSVGVLAGSKSLEFDSAGSPGARTGSETRSSSSTVIWCTTVAKTGVNTGTVDVTVLSNTVGQQGATIADIQSKQVFTKFYQSPNTAWTAGGLLEFSHNLGQPKMVQVMGILTAATTNFPVGTIFSLNVWVNTNYWGAQIVAETSTIVRVRLASALAVIFSSVSGDQPTPANSQIFVRVAA